MKKRILSIFIIITICLSTYFPVLSVKAAANGSCGENLDWSLSSAGVLTISGTGNMSGWGLFEGSPPWNNVRDEIKSVIIKNGVQNIESLSFSFCKNLKSVTIPESVEYIKANAFWKCYNIDSVNISGIDSWCRVAFESPEANPLFLSRAKLYLNNEFVTKLVIPANLEFVNPFTFAGCSSITTVTVENGIGFLGDACFLECLNLTSINLPESIYNISSSIFEECSSLTNIEIDKNNAYYTSDDNVLFTKDKLQLICCPPGKSGEYTIPDTVTYIGDGAFATCKKLTRINLPYNLQTISSFAFADCDGLTSLYIPENVVGISGDTFAFCKADINISKDNADFTSIDGVVFSKDKTMLIHCPFEKKDTYTIPDGVETIGEYAFELCKKITGIVIPETVTNISDCAFMLCDRLKNVFFTGTQEQWNSINICEGNEDLINASIHCGTKWKELLITNSVKLICPHSGIYIGDTLRLYAFCLPLTATNKKITWSSSDSSVVSVDANGKVTGIKKGQATITAKSYNGKSASCKITVYDPSICMLPYDSFKYEFGNNRKDFGYSDNYFIPQERYFQAGLPAKTELWGGNCFGISASSILFYKNVLQEERYSQTASTPKDFGISVSENKKLRDMIELFQVAKALEPCKALNNFDNIVSELKKGNPVLISAKKLNDEGQYMFHAVVIYSYNECDNGTYIFDIYDCSSYVTQLYSTDKTLKKDGADTGWTAYGYNTFEDLKNIYNKIRETNSYDNVSLFSLAEEPTYMYIITPADDLTIINSQNQTSTITGGEISGTIADIGVVPSSYLAENPTYTIVAPADTYTIAGDNEATITKTYMNNYISVSVTTKANTLVTLSEDLNSVFLATQENDEYTVTYTTYDNPYDKITLSGTAGGNTTFSINGSEITVTGAKTMNVSATVSDYETSLNTEDLSVYGKINVRCDEDVNAYAIQIFGDDSEITEKVFLEDRVALATPEYDLESGYYNEGQQLSFSKDDNTVIYYTTDGSTPSKDNGAIYSFPIEINKSMTIKAISTKYGYKNSEILELEYVMPSVIFPYANYETGEYNNVITVELNSKNNENKIYYTIDGSDPYTNGILYSSPVTLYEDTHLQAYTVSNGCISEVCEYEYTIAAEYPFSFSNSPVNQNGEIINLENIEELTQIKQNVTNLSGIDQTGTFIIIFYDENGKMLYVDYQKETVTEDNKEIIFDIEKDISSAYRIKIIAWDNLSDLNPLAEPFEQINS